MIEHTPGPWIVEKTRLNLYIGPAHKDAPDEVDFAVVAIPLDGLKTAKLRSAALADGRLIAQAPRMLESLKGCRAIIHAELLSILDSHCDIGDDGEPIRATLEEEVEQEVKEFEEVLADIDSIVAKAEGRQP